MKVVALMMGAPVMGINAEHDFMRLFEQIFSDEGGGTDDAGISDA